jgi:hypothetical protein
MQMGLVYRLPYLDVYQEKGGLSHVYGLTDKGITIAEIPLDTKFSKPFDEHSQRTLDHELEISFFHIALKRFCATHDLFLYWRQADLKKTIHPDALFAITDPKKPDGKNTNWFFLEIERSKIGNVRDGEPSIIRKLGAYYDYYNSDECEKEWQDFKMFRVVVVQRTHTRRKNLLKVLEEKYKHRMFWLTTEAAHNYHMAGQIFATPKDYSANSYSLLDI